VRDEPDKFALGLEAIPLYNKHSSDATIVEEEYQRREDNDAHGANRCHQKVRSAVGIEEVTRWTDSQRVPNRIVTEESIFRQFDISTVR
jgi:hypothetical protein